MRGTLNAGGVGVAAPQLDMPIQLAVVGDQCRTPDRLSPERIQEQERVLVL
jgi:peptide deformylase